MIRPTARALIATATAIPVSLAIVLTSPENWTVALGYLGFILGMIGLDWALSPSRAGLEVAATAPGSLYIGEEDDLSVEVRSAGLRGLLHLRALPALSPPLQRSEERRARMAGRQTVELAFPLRAERRGTGRVEKLWLGWTGPMKLIEKIDTLHLDREVAILPNIRSVKQAALRLQARDAFFGNNPQHQLGDGSEFDSLREHLPGMDTRSIDWKHSARHHRLVSKEFLAERDRQIILAFDTGYLMSEPDSGIPRLDHAINAGLLLSYACVSGGDRVGIYGFDSNTRQFMKPGSGIAAFHRIQEICARLEYSAEETNFTLGLSNLAGRLNRRSLIVLFTDFVDTVTAELMLENVQRLSRRHLVLFVALRDRTLDQLTSRPPESLEDVSLSVTAHDFQRERQVVLEKLKRLGVHVIEAPSHGIGADVINHYLRIKRLELI